MKDLSQEKDKHLIIILKEMCKRVRAPQKIVNSSDDWFMKYSWSKKKQDNFIEWMTDYLYNNREARNELLSIPMLKTKKHLRECANYFVFNYGWTYEKDK